MTQVASVLYSTIGPVRIYNGFLAVDPFNAVDKGLGADDFCWFYSY